MLTFHHDSEYAWGDEKVVKACQENKQEDFNLWH